jgi:hypothetical protein
MNYFCSMKHNFSCQFEDMFYPSCGDIILMMINNCNNNSLSNNFIL